MSTVQGGQGNIVTNGLVLNLDAANPRSYPQPYNGTTWTDLSGNLNNGTLISGSSYTGSNGGSITFNGTTNYVNIPYQSSLRLSSQGTLNIWCYPTTLTQGSYAGLIGMTTGGNANQQSYLIHWRKLNNTIQAAIQNAGTYNVIETPLPTSIAWYNFTFTWNGSFLNLYRNGISVSTPIAQTINAQALTATVDVGGKMFQGDSGNNGYFTGYIPNTQIYNRALSSSEVLQNFNATRARFGV